MSDLISRKAVLSILHNKAFDSVKNDEKYNLLRWCMKQIESLPTIQPQGIDKDRLIEELYKAPLIGAFDRNTGNMTPCIALDDAIKTINEQPTLDGWIPVSERLPDENMWCLVTYQSGEVEKVKYCTTNNWGQNDECITAWQPLPPAYKESENNV